MRLQFSFSGGYAPKVVYHVLYFVTYLNGVMYLLDLNLLDKSPERLETMGHEGVALVALSER